ncbi:hypothetical protein CR513_15946, partial [Mucuna pruriens]
KSGKYIPTKKDGTEILRSSWNEYQKTRFLGKTYDNYDNITKILQSLPRQWRPQVTALKVSKDLKKLPMEELLGTLKVHQIELNKDEGQRKGKSIALNTQKVSKGSSSKAFKDDESCEKASKEEGFDEDRLSFISRKIHFM